MIGVPKGLWPQYFDIAKWEGHPMHPSHFDISKSKGHPMHPSHFKAGMRREMTRRLIEETKWKNPIRALLQIFRRHLDG